MSEINVFLDRLNLTVPEIKRVSDKLDNVSHQLKQIGSRLAMDSSETEHIAEIIRRLSENTSTEADRTKVMADKLKEIIHLYHETEAQLLNEGESVVTEHQSTESSIIGTIMQIIRSFLIAIGILPAGSSNGTSEYAGEPVDMCIGNYVNDVCELMLSGDVDDMENRSRRNITEVRNAVGNAEICDYDDMGRIIRHTDMDGNILQYHYYPGGLVAGVSDRDRQVVSYRYDSAARLTGMTDGTGESSFRFNSDGNLIQARDGSGHCLDYGFNTFGKQELLTADGVEYQMQYDDIGRVKSLGIDGETVKYRYDGDGRLLKKEMPNNMSERYEYTAAG